MTRSSSSDCLTFQSLLQIRLTDLLTQQELLLHLLDAHQLRLLDHPPLRRPEGPLSLLLLDLALLHLLDLLLHHLPRLRLLPGPLRLPHPEHQWLLLGRLSHLRHEPHHLSRLARRLLRHLERLLRRHELPRHRRNAYRLRPFPHDLLRRSRKLRRCLLVMSLVLLRRRLHLLHLKELYRCLPLRSMSLSRRARLRHQLRQLGFRGRCRLRRQKLLPLLLHLR